MKRHLKTSFAVAAASALALTASIGNASEVELEGAKPGHWTMDFDAAKEVAAEKKLPLLLNFTGSDWCGWCKLMDKNVFAEDKWKEFAKENTMLVTLDFPKDETIVPEKYKARNRELQEEFGVQGYPTYVILDSDGKTKLGQLGAGKEKTPSSFIEEFEGVTQMSAAAIDEYVKEHPDKAEAYKAAIAEARASKQALMDWIKTGPQRNEENNEKYAKFLERIKSAEEELKKF